VIERDVYGYLRWLATKLVKENESDENPQDFTSTHRTSN